MIISIDMFMTQPDLDRHDLKDASEIGYVLQKNPANTHTKDLSFGKAHLMFDMVTKPDFIQDFRCADYIEPGDHLAFMSFTLIPVIDENKIVRGSGSYKTHPLEAFVNDTAFTFGTHTATALVKMFSKTMSRGVEHPLADAIFNFVVDISNVVIEDESDVRYLRSLFNHMGALAVKDPEGDHGIHYSYLHFQSDDHVHRTLYSQRDKAVMFAKGSLPAHGLTNMVLEYRGTTADLLSFVYLLGHLLDRNKHYYMGADEMERFDRFCRPVLFPSQERLDAVFGHEGKRFVADVIRESCNRFFAGNKQLANAAFDSFSDYLTVKADAEEAEEASTSSSETTEELSLHERRHKAILSLLDRVKLPQPYTVVDAGCSAGQLMKKLVKWGEDQPKRPNLIGLDPMMKNVVIVKRKLARTGAPGAVYQSSIRHRDSRLRDLCDVMILSEVIEHLDLPDVSQAIEVIKWYAPEVLIVTTPNKAYNSVLHEKYAAPGTPKREFRHWDHRWEMEFDGEMSPQKFCDMMLARSKAEPDLPPLFEGVRFGMVGDPVVINDKAQAASFLFVFFTHRAAPMFAGESAILSLNPTWK
jgi:2-polyprenyl-3-methyl-5-hydroxy-6-metoxy-1,4-benzoquinol methylase